MADPQNLLVPGPPHSLFSTHTPHNPSPLSSSLPPLLSQGGGGNPLANIGGLMENMRKAQEEAAKVQAELSAAEFEGFSSCETVRVVMTGAQEPRSVDITEEAYAQGSEALAALVTEAMKDAHGKSVNGMKARMREMASSLGLPGMPGGM
jgi:DNA-binding YbaB/EbfC family protein